MRITPAVGRIMVITCLMFGLQWLIRLICGGPALEGWLALLLQTPQGLPLWQVWRLFTYALLHYDISHLFWNMLGLWLVGATLEEYLGAARLYRCYAFSVFCGAISALLCAALGLNSGADYITLMGASAGTMGILFTFIGLAPQSTMYLWCLIVIPVKALYLGLILGAIQVGGLLFHGASHTSYSAHLGGIIAGLLLAQALRRRWDKRVYEAVAELKKRWKRRHIRIVK